MSLAWLSLGKQKGKEAVCNLEHLCPVCADAQRNLFPDFYFSLDGAAERSLEFKTWYYILSVICEHCEPSISPVQRKSLFAMCAHISNLQHYPFAHYTPNCTAAWQGCHCISSSVWAEIPHWFTLNDPPEKQPHSSKEISAALCDGAGEESGKACRARSWDSFLQQCPQLVQLQLLGKFHLGFHCLPHSIPYYICNSLSEAHHYVSPLFLNSSPGFNVGKVWTASRINRALANISVPPPPRQWLLYRGQSWKPGVNTWKPLQKTQDSDSTWSHKTSKVLSETWGWWEFCVPVPAWIWG